MQADIAVEHGQGDMFQPAAFAGARNAFAAFDLEFRAMASAFQQRAGLIQKSARTDIQPRRPHAGRNCDRRKIRPARCLRHEDAEGLSPRLAVGLHEVESLRLADVDVGGRNR